MIVEHLRKIKKIKIYQLESGTNDQLNNDEWHALV